MTARVMKEDEGTDRGRGRLIPAKLVAVISKGREDEESEGGDPAKQMRGEWLASLRGDETQNGLGKGADQ